jgi:PAS domain-containing protein
MAEPAKPLEVILARNLIAAVAIPGFVTDTAGDIVFYNDAAGRLLGHHFEETGRLTREQWEQIGPLDAGGDAMPEEPSPLNVALRDGRPAHGRFRIRLDDHRLLLVETSAVPLAGASGPRGAVVVFWPAEGEPGA